MNATIIPSVVISVFLIFVILGFVCGWFRGLSKSLIRFIMVLGVGVLCFFVVPELTKSILTLDISKLNIVIGQVHVITVQDLVTDLLRQLPYIEDIINSSPTFESFLEIMPLLLCNVLLFVVFFFLFKWVSMIIYWIFAGIFFSKKKTEGKEKHGFIGAIVGALQGFVVACIVFVPVFGLVETAQPIVAITAQEQVEEGAETPTAFYDGIYYTNTETTPGETPDPSTETTESSGDIVLEMANNVEVYVKAFENNWVYKMLDAIGIRKLSVNMFDTLSTIEDRDVEYNLRREVGTIAKAYPEIQKLSAGGFSLEDNEKLDIMKKAIDILYESPTVSGMVKEMIPSISEKWSNGATFCGISKPTLGDEGLDDLLDSLLVKLSVSQGDSVKTDIETGIDLIKICNDTELLKTLTSGSGNIIDVLKDEKNKEMISDIISKALESNTFKDVLPDVINVAMNKVYDALGIKEDEIEDITITSAEVNWDIEKLRLQAIFTDVIEVYDKVQSAPKGKTLESLDFELVGLIFENLRSSQLLGQASMVVMEKLLSTPSIVGDTNTTVLEPMVGKLKTIWEEPTVDLAKTFKSLGEAIIIAKDVQTSVDNISVEKLEEVFETLAENDAVKEVVKEAVQTETLGKLGVDDKTAQLINETVVSIIDADYSESSGNNIKTEANAVKEILVVANKVLNNDTTTDPGKIDNVVISDTDSETIINALADSTVVLNALTDTNATSISTLGLADSLSTESKTNISAAISKLDTNTYDAATIEKLNKLFGLSEDTTNPPAELTV